MKNKNEPLGKEEILQIVKEVLLPYPEHQIHVQDKTIHIRIDNIPFYILIQHYVDTGWHVILFPKQPDLLEDKISFGLYDQIENRIQEINFKYYNFPKEKGIYSRLQIIEKYAKMLMSKPYRSPFIKQVTRKKCEAIRIDLNVSDAHETTPYIEIGYSNIFDKWYVEYHGMKDVQLERLKERYSTLHRKLTQLLGKWNNKTIRCLNEISCIPATEHTYPRL